MGLLRIYYAMLPLRCVHISYLEQTADLGTNRQLQANWANGYWKVEVSSVLDTLSNKTVMNKLEMLAPGTAHSTPSTEEQGTASILAELVICMASNRGWSMAIHSVLPPDNWVI
jgi:hypothetical protein